MLFLQGERLSHAVGCAFAVCLERKQKRDKDCSVTMNFDNKNSTFTRLGSFRQVSMRSCLSEIQGQLLVLVNSFLHFCTEYRFLNFCSPPFVVKPCLNLDNDMKIGEQEKKTLKM